jgi:HAD superfamily hydrolase (TIGR01484 family)
MQALSQAPAGEFSDVRFVLTDMDETLTRHGRLAANVYTALERLQADGFRVIPVTAAPSGWCDQMARMWPVDGVIAENGGIFLQRQAEGHGVVRRYWDETVAREDARNALTQLANDVLARVPGSRLADDQSFRLTSVAFERSGVAGKDAEIVETLRAAGADATINNLWVLGWFGGYDKLKMSGRTLLKAFGVDIHVEGHKVLYSGDSLNDAPMFAFFRNTVGVSTVRDYLDVLPKAPAWVTNGPGGDGFVEIANRLLRDARRRPA